MNQSILWLIPARSGSKSIKHKNIKKLAGLPLLAYRIKSALTIAKTEDIWVSTESVKYAKIAQSFGATAPFLRPQNLSLADTRSEDVVLHALEYAQSLGKKYDGLGLLQPTSPFITPAQLSKAVSKLFKNQFAKHIVAVKQNHPSTFFIQKNNVYLKEIAKKIKNQPNLTRQNLATEIAPCGGFFISKWSAFKKSKTFYTPQTLSYLIPAKNALDIDEPLDWLWAEFLLAKKIITKKEIFTLY